MANGPLVYSHNPEMMFVCVCVWCVLNRMDVYEVMKTTVASGRVIRAQRAYLGSPLFPLSDTFGGLFVFAHQDILFSLILI